MKHARRVASAMSGSAAASIYEDNELKLLCSVLTVGIISAIFYT